MLIITFNISYATLVLKRMNNAWFIFGKVYIPRGPEQINWSLNHKLLNNGIGRGRGKWILYDRGLPWFTALIDCSFEFANSNRPTYFWNTGKSLALVRYNIFLIYTFFFLFFLMWADWNEHWNHQFEDIFPISFKTISVNYLAYYIFI